MTAFEGFDPAAIVAWQVLADARDSPATIPSVVFRTSTNTSCTNSSWIREQGRPGLFFLRQPAHFSIKSVHSPYTRLHPNPIFSGCPLVPKKRPIKIQPRVIVSAFHLFPLRNALISVLIYVKVISLIWYLGKARWHGCPSENEKCKNGSRISHHKVLNSGLQTTELNVCRA